MAYVDRRGALRPGSCLEWKEHVNETICFYCGKLLVPPLIFWAGETGALGLHPECCERLMTRLAMDVHSAQCDRK